MFDTDKIVQALFYDGQCSDLQLIVGDRSFHCHRFVMIPVSRFLQQSVQWPSDAIDDANSVRIELPDFRTPDSLGSLSHDKISYFEIYLKVVYGLHQLSLERATELCEVAQIADFMMSDAVLELCDRLLCSKTFLSLNTEMGLFCERFSLSSTLDRVKLKIAADLQRSASDENLHRMGPSHFIDIIRLCSESTRWQFWNITGYAAGVNLLESDMNDANLQLETRLRDRWIGNVIPIASGRGQLYEDLLNEVSKGWEISTVNDIYDDIQTTKIVFEGAEKCHKFLCRIIAQAYRRLSTPSVKAH